MWPMIAAAGIGAAGSIAGGILGSSSADDAGKHAKDIYKDIKGRLDPWRKYGKKALLQLWKYIENPELVTEMPGYQFALGEGTKTLLRARSATGNLQSGAAGRELTRYGQEYGTTNWLKYLSPYQEMANAGQNAVVQQANTGTSMAGILSNNALAKGAAQVGMIGNLTNSITGGIKDWYYMNQMNNLNNALSSGNNQYQTPYNPNYINQMGY